MKLLDSVLFDSSRWTERPYPCLNCPAEGKSISFSFTRLGVVNQLLRGPLSSRFNFQKAYSHDVDDFITVSHNLNIKVKTDSL